jgi:hypothetical protein
VSYAGQHPAENEKSYHFRQDSPHPPTGISDEIDPTISGHGHFSGPPRSCETFRPIIVTPNEAGPTGGPQESNR